MNDRENREALKYPYKFIEIPLEGKSIEIPVGSLVIRCSNIISRLLVAEVNSGYDHALDTIKWQWVVPGETVLDPKKWHLVPTDSERVLALRRGKYNLGWPELERGSE